MIVQQLIMIYIDIHMVATTWDNIKCISVLTYQGNDQNWVGKRKAL